MNRENERSHSSKLVEYRLEWLKLAPLRLQFLNLAPVISQFSVVVFLKLQLTKTVSSKSIPVNLAPVKSTSLIFELFMELPSIEAWEKFTPISSELSIFALVKVA